jgi:hypothetical protein
MRDGRRLGHPPKPFKSPTEPAGKVNLTDPDSKPQKTNAGFGCVQGYNPQAVVSEQQIVLAAEITNSTADFSQLDPIVTATLSELEHAGVKERPKVAIADAGHWNEEHIDEVVAGKHVQVLIPPDAGNRTTPRPGWSGGRYDWKRRVLRTDFGPQALPAAQENDRAGVRPHQASGRRGITEGRGNVLATLVSWSSWCARPYRPRRVVDDQRLVRWRPAHSRAILPLVPSSGNDDETAAIP